MGDVASSMRWTLSQISEIFTLGYEDTGMYSNRFKRMFNTTYFAEILSVPIILYLLVINVHFNPKYWSTKVLVLPIIA